MLPLDNVSLRQCVPWMMCPLDMASLTEVSCHRAESKGFVTIYECVMCVCHAAAPLKSYLTQPSIGQHDPMFLDPSVRDALSKGRLQGIPQARDASSETFSSEAKQNCTESITYMYYHFQIRIKDLRSSSFMFGLTAMSV
jgi:hypothetical protein